MISSCNALGMLQLQLCHDAPGRGKEEGWEGCCRGGFGIQTFLIHSGTFISLAFGNLRLLEAAVPLRQGIAVRFALSDGQTLTVLHHQPPRA